MRIVLVRPDVSVPLHVFVISLVGAIGDVGASIWYLTHIHSMCAALPVFSVSSALFAILPWNLRHARVNVGGRRLAGLLIAGAVLWGVAAMWCRRWS